jgi:ribosomal-protein-alanine N-acetyltransferase
MMDTLLDHIMGVMEDAFDPAFGEAWTRRQVSDSLAMPNIHTLVVDEHGKPPAAGQPAAGFALSRRVADEEELLLIAVRMEARGKSLGTRLLGQFFASARAVGVKRVFLEMRDGNPAEKFYLVQGFTPIGRRKLYYLGKDGVRRDAITFGKTLG